MATQIINRTLGTLFANAAADALVWSQEKQFFQIQAQAVMKTNESLRVHVTNGNERTIESLRNAALACAAMGLSMNPMAALVYFIPRRERKRDPQLYPDDKSQASYEANVPWIIDATPSYRGLAWIATHYAGADDIAAEIVYADEIAWQRGGDRPANAPVFEYRGPLELPFHRPALDNAHRMYQNAVGVYCAMRWPGGRARCEYIDAPTIEKIRAMSERPNATMWHPEKLWTEGWKKAAVRRAAKLGIQGNPRMSAAETAMNSADGRIIDGEAVEVPRGTSGADEEGRAAQATKRRASRGMGGLSAGLDAAAAQHDAAQAVQGAESAAINAQEARSDNPPPTPAEGHDPLAALKARLSGRHPEGVIEWWAELLEVVTTRAELTQVRDSAILAGVDKTEDSVAFTDLYRKRSQSLREAGL